MTVYVDDIRTDRGRHRTAEGTTLALARAGNGDANRAGNGDANSASLPRILFGSKGVTWG